MKRITEVLFWAGVLMTVCCGCRWCGQDFKADSIPKSFGPKTSFRL